MPLGASAGGDTERRGGGGEAGRDPGDAGAEVVPGKGALRGCARRKGAGKRGQRWDRGGRKGRGGTAGWLWDLVMEEQGGRSWGHPAPRTSHPQDQLPARLLGAVEHLAEELPGVVLPGEGGGEAQVVADPAGVQLQAGGHGGDALIVARPAQGHVAQRADVGRGALEGDLGPLRHLLAGRNAGALQDIWGWGAEDGTSSRDR